MRLETGSLTCKLPLACASNLLRPRNGAGFLYYTKLMKPVLAFDIGGTTSRWALVSTSGKLLKFGETPSPRSEAMLLRWVSQLIQKSGATHVGVAIAGTVSVDHLDTLVCTNLTALSHRHLSAHIATHAVTCLLENDARCALLGEQWLGSARHFSNVLMLTIGTGVGGALLRGGEVLPHPTDLAQELGRLMIDRGDLFPTESGSGTLEALLGGKNLEARFGVKLAEIAAGARRGNRESLRAWVPIQELTHRCLAVLADTYAPERIIIGGKGGKDLEWYVGEAETPVPVVPAALGERAGLLGAAKLVLG